MFAARSLRKFQIGSRNVAAIQKKVWTPTITKTYNSSRLFSAPAAAYNQTVDVFPSIVIGSDGNLSAQGPFAESQAHVSCCCILYVSFIDICICDLFDLSKCCL